MTHVLGWVRGAQPDAVRAAAWVARCVGRGETAPLGSDDLALLATVLQIRRLAAGETLFSIGEPAKGVWIVRSGRIELAVGTGRRRAVVHLLHPGDVDGDIHLLLGMPAPYTARAVDAATVLHLPAAEYERLLTERPRLARRWLTSVATRLARSQMRVLALLGGSLTQQVAKLLLDEVVDDRVELPQRTLAAMLGVQRPSLNRVLGEFRDKGLIEIGYRSIHVLDAGGLAAQAER